LARPIDPDRTYRHFCMMARALEVVGERWSLLIIRDLLLGPRRFTDLARSLPEITPTRLTVRLRQLEAAGLVERESPGGGREVWYRLTEAGHDLSPAVDALTLWGIEHALQPPLAGEPVPPEPLMIGTKVWLNRYGTAPADGLAWTWRFPGEDHYTLRVVNGAWELTRGKEEEAVLTVDATREAWASFLTTPRGKRRLPGRGIRLEGSRGDVRAFAEAFRARLTAS
jgi:DNA-binding HxlR family transcriptional regulator